MISKPEPPLTRQEILRRVIQLAGSCLGNVASYQAGWKDQKPVFSGELQRRINGNFLDMAVLEWCKLFGEDKHEPQHWQRVIGTIDKRTAFKSALMTYLACEKRDWSALRTRAINYRNDFLAHLGLKREMKLPHLGLIQRSVLFYAAYLREHEDDGRTYGTQPDTEAYYQFCLDEASHFYSLQRRTTA